MKYVPPYYTLLFDCVTYAIEALRQQDYIGALDTLILAQKEAEEMYLKDGDEEDEEDEEDFPRYSPWEIARIEEESEALEMQILIRESQEVFRMLKQEQKARQEEQSPTPNH